MEIFASHYVVDFDPFAIRFPDGFFLAGVRWYGLAYLAGFIIALLLFNLYSSKGRSPYDLFIRYPALAYRSG